MALVMAWIAPLIMATLCLIFIGIAQFTIKLSSVQVATAEAMKAVPKEPATEIFAVPKFPTLLCAILASSIQNVQIIVAFTVSSNPILMGSEWQKYVRNNSAMITAFFYPLSGAVAGYVGVRLWKSMKGHDLISQGWLMVSLLIPFLSIGTLYSTISYLGDHSATTFSWHASLVSGFWLSISMLSTQLGGYLGMRSRHICLPIVISKSTRIKNYWAWTVSLVLAFLASVVLNVEPNIVVVHAFPTGCMVYLAVEFALVTLLLASSYWLWLAIMNMQLCFGNLGCCWWKAFLTLAVPYGLYTGLRSIPFWEHSQYLIESIFLVSAVAVIFGSIGVHLVFNYYRPQSRLSNLLIGEQV